MALPRFGMLSVEFDSVTHARGSADYAYNFVQWQIGFSSLWAWSIGIAPLKDTFHSIHVQPEADADGDVPGDIFNEHFPDLHAAVSLFSMGPFVPGDRTGYEDELILSRSYNANGLLLRLDEPLTPIDAELIRKARNETNGPSSGHAERLDIFGDRFGSQIWTTKSEINTRSGHVVLYAELVENYLISSEELGIDEDSVYLYRGYPELLHDEELTFPVLLNSAEHWGLLYGGIKMNLGWSFPIVVIGEINKWAHISPQVRHY